MNNLLTHPKVRQFLPLLILLVIAVAGYGSYVLNMGLLDDDIAGRFKGISNESAIATQIDNFRTWIMGRPFGHMSNATFQTIFRDLPEPYILSFAIFAITLQAYMFFKIGRLMGLASKVSMICAIFYFLTAGTPPLFLPVHSLATELSTWFLIGSIFLILRGHALVAGFVLALHINTYETYLTIFFTPIIFWGVKEALAGKVEIRKSLIVASKYTAAFLFFVAVFLYIRDAMPGSGREATMADMSAMDVVNRMIAAARLGGGTLRQMHFESWLWAMNNGPSYILAAFVFFFTAYYYALRYLIQPSGAREQHLLLGLIVLIAAVVIIYMSYMIYFTQRYPPTVKIARLANIHSGSRVGVFLFTMGLMFVIQSMGRRVRYAAVTLLALGASSLQSFHHAYGYQESLSSQKKFKLVEAMKFACENATPDDKVILVAPIEFSQRKTDVIMGWTTPHLAITQFRDYQNKFLIVAANNAEKFKQMLQSKPQPTLNDIEPYIYFIFKNYPHLSPQGDFKKWDYRKGDIVVVDIRYEGGAYSFHMLKKSHDDPGGRKCWAR